MIKTNQKLFSFILALCIVFTFFSANINVNASSVNTENYDLISIAEWIENKPTTRSSETTPTEVTILQNTNTIQEVKFVEGNKCNIVLYNKTTDELFIDGERITVTEVKPEISTYGYLPASSHSYQNIEYKQILMQMTVAALIAAIIYAIPVFTKPIASFFASEISNRCVASGYAYSKCTYCHSYVTVADDYTHYIKYWDMFWDASYNKVIESYSQEIW